MNCIEAREAMLTAEPSELAGSPVSPLAEHLAECEDCRALAGVLTRELGALTTLVRHRAAARTRRIHRSTAIGALAAAAVIIAFVIPRHRGAPPTAVPASTIASGISVDVAPGQQAAVIATRDPKVTVVWIIRGGGH